MLVMVPPDRNGPLRDVWARIDWAARRLDELDTEVETFLSREPYAIRNDFYAQTNKWVVSLSILETPPAQISQMVSEVVHGLRSALDHLVCVFTGESCERTGFPIYTCPEKNEKRNPAMTDGAGEAALDVITRSQPFQVVSIGQPSTDSLLHQLHELWNRDKHRAIHIAATTMSDMKITVPVPCIFEETNYRGPLEDGAVLAVISCPKMPDQMYVQYDLSPTVGFGEGSGPATGMPIVEMLRGTYETVRAILLESEAVI